MAMNYNYDWLGYTCSPWVVGGWKCTADIHIVAGKMTTVNIPQKPTKHNLLVTGCQRLRSMYIYMCIYIYTHTSYIYIYTYAHHIYLYIHHTHIPIYTYTIIYMYLHATINTHLRTFQHDLMPRDPMVRRLDFAWGEELQRFPAEGSDACGESTQGRRDRGRRPLGWVCSGENRTLSCPCWTYFKHFEASLFWG